MRRFLWMVVVLTPACAWREQVLNKAAADLDCEARHIRLSQEGSTVRAEGCDKRAVYAQRDGQWEMADFRESEQLRQDRAKKAAVIDLKCSEERIEVTSLDYLYRAQGCGRVAVYNGRSRELQLMGRVVQTCKRQGEEEGMLGNYDLAPPLRTGPEIPPELPAPFVATHCQAETSEFRCTVDATGRARKCCAVSPVPFTEWPIAESLMRTQYKPALVDGKPAEKQYLFRVTIRPVAGCHAIGQ